ncbi:glycosyltransferase family 2 protein [archaeon]|nr:glycosyltransferase family 2 protein [archaeon]
MISIIVPCYNEETRITPFLKKLMMETNDKKYEVIIVNDGSTDSTLEIVSALIKNRKNTRILSYKKNMGKGFAIKTGVFSAKGDFIIFIDADGSIDPAEIKNMEKYAEKYDAVIGTRASKESVVKKQPVIRKMLGMTFNLYVNVIFGIKIKDTLCGFKGFKRDVARVIFNELKSNRWIFDVELFYKIKKGRFSLYQMPIHWVHKENTKIRASDPLKMFVDVFSLRIKLLRG